jgi:hydrogenase nickel incorporation protein HypA/HybF
VVAVHLRLGPLSGVVKEALLGAYGLASEASAVAGSRLVIEDVPVLAWCPACRADQPVVSIQNLCCRECGTPTAQVVSGRDLEVTAMEIADEPSTPREHAPADSPGRSSAEGAQAK